MPWKSQAQAAWGHSPAGVKALGGASNVAEWDAASKGNGLPQRIATPKTIPHRPSKGGKGNKR